MACFILLLVESISRETSSWLSTVGRRLCCFGNEIASGRYPDRRERSFATTNDTPPCRAIEQRVEDGAPDEVLPDGRYVQVELDVGVVGEQRQIVIDRLRDEDTVERVSVVVFEVLDRKDVLIGDGKHGDPILSQFVM
jgi:hypothetical protein